MGDGVCIDGYLTLIFIVILRFGHLELCKQPGGLSVEIIARFRLHIYIYISLVIDFVLSLFSTGNPRQAF